MKKYVASCSFGKDSMATVLLALEHNEPLHEVVYCEVLFDRETSGEVPEHRAFIHDTAIPFLKGAGIKVNIVQGEKLFVDLFRRTIGENGLYAGRIWSWPLCGRCYVQRDCKVRPMEAYQRANWSGQDIVQYIGIADDEADRLVRLEGSNKISLLEKYKKTEDDARAICQRYGLLSPAYEFTCRNGCWFCPNAKEKELRHLYDHHRDMWNKMLRLQALPNKATELFTRELRFDEIDAAFRMDDAQTDIFGEREAIPFEIRDFHPQRR